MTILIVGAKGTGKTTAVKNAIQAAGLPVFIYDINQEYGSLPVPSMDEFTEQASRLKRCTIVFEEATIFFSTRGRSENLLKILVQSRHNKTITILVLHSLRAVPVYILELSNAMILKNTNDNPTAVEGKFGDFPEIIEAFRENKKTAEIDRYQSKEIHFL